MRLERQLRGLKCPKTEGSDVLRGGLLTLRSQRGLPSGLPGQRLRPHRVDGRLLLGQMLGPVLEAVVRRDEADVALGRVEGVHAARVLHERAGQVLLVLVVLGVRGVGGVALRGERRRDDRGRRRHAHAHQLPVDEGRARDVRAHAVPRRRVALHRGPQVLAAEL